MVSSRLCETVRPWLQNSRPRLKRFYQIRARDITSKKSEPEALSAEKYEIMVQIFY